MTYLFLKWLHIVAAIVLVGAHITYGVWIVRASSHPEALPFVLRNIKWLDDRISVPAYAVLLGAGLVMVFTAGLSLTIPWLLTSLILFVIMVLAHLLGYSRIVRQLIHLLDREGSSSPNYQAVAAREANLGIALIVIMIVIVFLMVVKPGLWA